MKKTLAILVFALQLSIAGKVFATSSDSIALSKSYYNQAKDKLVEMLDGKRPLSYERAIYLIENAYWDNRLSPISFKAAIDSGVSTIKWITISNTTKQAIAPTEDLWEQMKSYRAKELGYFEKAQFNWGIFSYMTDTIETFKNNALFYKEPYKYSFNDPFGTIDWANTQVSHLLESGNGNCFALASLFKIFSERLSSDADICTAPGHVYITHRNERGTYYNIEVASKSFPGTGTMETLTYTTNDAVKNDISLRQLNQKQSIALCLVYLAKGYEYKLKLRGDNFALQCADLALKYDSLNLNAMLLKAEVLETSVLNKNKTIAQLQSDKTFKEYQKLISNLYLLGYREMPLEMKNILINHWMHDRSTVIVTTNHTDKAFNKIDTGYNRYASLSWGVFDEEIRNKPAEKYSHILFDTKKKVITKFVKEDVLYNDYSFDPVIFALNVDPMAYKYPGQSPYAAFDNSPIWKNDPTGASGEVAIDKQAKTITITSHMIFYGEASSTKIATQTAADIQNLWNGANGKVAIDGTQYNVRFNVTGESKEGMLGTAAVFFDKGLNTDVKNNYIEVKNVVPGGVSNMVKGGNEGEFQLNNIDGAGTTTEAHEYGHGLGLWPGTDDGHPPTNDIRGQGQPGIMYPRGTIVDPKYQYDPKAKAGASGGTLNPNSRKVTQSDINALGLDKLDYSKDGKANLGKSTSTW